MSYRIVTLALAAVAFLMGSSRAAAQFGLPANGNNNNPANNALFQPGGGAGNAGGGPGGILGNLAGGLPGQSGNTQQTPGLDPNGRFFNYSLVTGSGQLTGPLPIVTQFAGIAGMRNGGMGGMGGMRGMGGMGGMGMGGMGMGGMGMGGMGGGGFGGGQALGSGMGGLGGNGGLGGMANQQRNYMLEPPGVQLNVGYNTVFGLPLTQSPMGQFGNNMNPMMGGMGGMGMGRGRMGGGFGGGFGGGMGNKMMMGYGNGDYGL